MPMVLELYDTAGNKVFDLGRTRILSFIGIYPITWVGNGMSGNLGGGLYLHYFKGTLPITWSFATHMLSFDVGDASLLADYNNSVFDNHFGSIEDGYIYGQMQGWTTNNAGMLSDFKKTIVDRVGVYRY